MMKIRFYQSISQKTAQKTQKIVILSLVMSLCGFSTSFELAHAEFYSMLAPTDYTPANYTPPKYDAFDHDYYRPPVYDEEEPDTPPVAEFTITNEQSSMQSQARGTTSTRFIFDASNSTDNETDLSRMEVRWDFENDGVLDSYFSRTKSIRHIYTTPGIYTVKMEVLDQGGNVSSTEHTVTVVNNTPPSAFFIVDKHSGTGKTIFQFETQRSRDDQYLSTYLQYRFDWNADGKWDTKYQEKTTWNHRFEVPGTYNVLMEVKDPGGLTAQYSDVISVEGNTPPVANFFVKNIASTQGAGFQFDATSSSDNETAHNYLLYRWDFNNNGPDDIIYDTEWSASPMYSGYYSVPGTKTIRLDVKDEDGAISTTYSQVSVAWTEAMATRFMTGLR